MLAIASALLTLTASLSPQDPATPSHAAEYSIDSHPNAPFFVIPPRDAEAAKLALLVVMPGGPGTRDFLPWVENGIFSAAPDDCVGLMMTATKWRGDQRIVWPSAKAKVRGMRYTTESHVLAAIASVRQRFPQIDDDRIALLAWSSSGPVAYGLLSDGKAPFGRGYVAMSVWRDLSKAELAATEDRRFVLEQSPEDTTTTFPHVRQAFAALTGAGAIVRLSTYRGGHGWHDSPIPRLRQNLAWLFGDEPAPPPVWPGEDGAGDEVPEAVGKNLVDNGSFERGAARGWNTVGNSGRLEVDVDTATKTDGKRALHLGKQGGMPLDLVVQEVDLRRQQGDTVTFSLQARTEVADNAFVKLWLYDGDGEVVNQDAVDVAHLTGTAEWRRHGVRLPRGKAERAVIQLVVVAGGELWFDDVALTVADRADGKDVKNAKK
ncbi:MAG: carbohydrate binding domain-containing protein [Planctomycetes bacterium]|nr:carbohydrate binding domain-containing protein [Planctomycetota bacterium]